MHRFNESQFDRWWFGPAQDAAPGRVVPFVGAGVSIDAPTGLPCAADLTQALMYHLLEPRVANELLGTFARHHDVLGRPMPRLEALLSRAIDAHRDAIRLLELFHDVRPNSNHILLAHHLVRTRSWAVTTNFDEGIERASNFSIPVHVFDPIRNCVRTLYGGADARWGLIKLHGTISLGVHALAATIEQLTPGLHTTLRELLDGALGSADVVVVAGYSASDHFDVNAFLRLKMNKRYRARLMWIDHSQDERTPATFPGSSGFRAFQSAFNGIKVRTGRTADLMARILGESVPPMAAETGPDWRRYLHAPTRAPSRLTRHRIGATLTAHMGFGQLARECIAELRHELEGANVCLHEEARAFAIEGDWLLSYSLLHSHRQLATRDTQVDAAWILRAAGHPLRALVSCACLPSRPLPPLGKCVVAASLLDVCRSAMCLPRFLHRPLLAFLGLWADAQLSNVNDTLGDHATPVVKGICQLLKLRHRVYMGAFRDSSGALRDLIRDELSYPNFHTDRGPLVPGYYLLCATTAAELDLLPELLDVRLEYADILLMQVRAEYGGAIEHRDRYAAMDVQIALAVIKEQLDLAHVIAQMLNEDSARTRVARAWIEVDRAFKGMHHWKRQRLYLPPRRSERPQIEDE